MMNHPQTLETLPRVAFVATGGTIAGISIQGASTWSYESAQCSGESLLMGIPSLIPRAQWHFEQPYSIGSQNLSLGQMLQLRATLLRLLQSSMIDGIVVTHGTDTMEDMLYFLYLTLPTSSLNKPLLFTGSMLPSDHANADGPSNIISTFEFLVASLSKPKSPVPFGLVMQGFFTPAPAVEKRNTTGFDVFNGPCTVKADIDWYPNSQAFFEKENFDTQGQFSSLFDSTATQHVFFESIEVPVVFCTPGNGPIRQLNDLLNRKPASVVIAAPGHGNIPDSCVSVLRQLLKAGVSVVRASRVATGSVVQGGEFNVFDGFRENIDSENKAIFSEAGSLTLVKCVMRERLRFLAHNLSLT